MSTVSSFFSWITASFMNKIIYRADDDDSKNENDFSSSSSGTTNDTSSIVPVVKDELDTAILSDRFSEQWSKQLLHAKSVSSSSSSSSSSSRPSLLKALFATFYKEIIFAVLLKLGWGFFVLLSIAYFVRELLRYIRFKSTDPDHTIEERSEGIILAVIFFVVTVILSICIQQMNTYSARLGVRVKSVVSTIVYQKSLVIDKYQNSLDVVSIIATDCTKLASSCVTLHYLWSGVVESLAIIAVLLGFVGISALPALGLLLILVPVQYFIGMTIANMRKKVAAAADDRVHLMDEILRAIKLVKMYAWERKFAENVGVLRKKETDLARFNGILKSLNLALVFVLPPLIGIAIFGTYESLGNTLDGVFAFTALSLFNTLRLPLVQLPKGLRAIAEALAAAERVENYLLGPDKVTRSTLDNSSGSTTLTTKKTNTQPSIQFNYASFKYGSNPISSLTDSSVLLRNITMNIPNNCLVAIVGSVGSGKSNLVNAILGQMNCVQGTEKVHGSFAFVPQTPWCAHGTIRDNILFGQPWDEKKYRQVLWACALETDLQLFEDGDLTIMSPRGANASGGQRQRIALARAAYADADIVILDSPLSAVDMYTCQHIFNYCIKGLMAGKIIVLVTHQLELLPQADMVVVMEKGTVGYCGPFDNDKLAKFFPKNSALTDTDNHIAGTTTVNANDNYPPATGTTHPITDTIPEDGPLDISSQPDAEPTNQTNVSKVMEEMENIIHRSNSSIKRHASQRLRAMTNPDNTSTSTPVLHSMHSLHPPTDLSLSRHTSTGSTGNNQLGSSLPKPVAASPYVSSALPPTGGIHRLNIDDNGGKITSINDALNPSGAVLVRALSMRAGILKAALADGGDNSTPVRSRSNTAASHNLPIISRQVSIGGAKLSPSREIVVGPSPDLVLYPPGTVRPKSVRPRPVETPINPYFAFVKEAGYIFALISLSIFVITQVTRIYSDIWVSTWVAKRFKDQEKIWYTAVYGGYIACFFVLLLSRGFFYYYLGLRTASGIHNKMFLNILKAPMAFFNVTPLGKVLSVFSSDMDTIDEQLLDNIHMVVIYFMILCTTISVVIRVINVFAAIAGGLLLIAVFYFRPYLRASTKLKEAAGSTSENVVSHVSETLQGMAVIQAYRAESRFKLTNMEKVDQSSIATYNFEMLQLWLSYRLDFIGCLLVLGTCLLVVFIDRGITPSNAGLAISNSFQILLFFSLMVRGAADINGNIASVERVTRLGQVVPEKDLPLSHESCPPDSWPGNGIVDFNNVVMSYLPSAPHVLKGVTFNCLPGEKIGVVGRTGAGKSSLIMALFKLCELSEGAIRIDGIDVSKLNLAQLRKRISIIPQEPCLFRGTLRFNVDPFHEKTDEEIIQALQRCLLGDLLNSVKGLDYPVEHMGENFSLGTQQLISLARAMLNNSRLLLLDEATAALDLETDAKVQAVIRQYFADRTIITIAHRLDTIIDSDRILVMDAGRVAEFDTAYTLLFHRPTSIFGELCRRAGTDQYNLLKAAAARHAATLTLLSTQVQADDHQRYGTTVQGNNGNADGEEDDGDIRTIKEEIDIVVE